MVEPSAVNRTHQVHVYGSLNSHDWQPLLRWEKDRWPMSFFQYGNAFLPGGKNTTGLLALTTVAVAPGDLATTVWRVSHYP